MAPDGTAGYAGQVQMLLDPAVIGWRSGEPSGLPEMRGYFGLREERDPDALTARARGRRPAAGGVRPRRDRLGADGRADHAHAAWCQRQACSRVAARCRHVSGGWFDEEAEVWDSAGNLVAQSRQIARVGRGPGPRR